MDEPELQVHATVSPVFGASCYVVARGADAIVVDPGVAVAARVLGHVRAAGLAVHAVHATHGHPDHTWDAGALCAALGVPFVVGRPDVAAASDPDAALAAGGGGPAGTGVADAFRAAAAAAGGGSLRPPDDVRPTGPEPVTLSYGALTVDVLPAPGHTPGSALLRVGDVVLTGDVLFAGTIGRTDLPGGDGAAMRRTLRDVVATLDPALTVLPGHGPATTVGHELATNPFLAGAFLAGA